MRQMLILADDLSGAADCASACTHHGLSAAVSFGQPQNVLDCDVLSIDCDTRRLPSDEAAERVRAIMRANSAPGGGQIVFKKVDSTLRGNVGSEIRAVLEEQRRSSADAVAILAPAFPSRGRSTIHGYQFVHGAPLHETEIWKQDCLAGVAHIPSMLGREGLRIGIVDLHLLRAGEERVAEEMRQIAREVDVMVCDAETEEDLATIARASFLLGRQTVWVGSAGLAFQLPHAAGLVGSGPHRRKPQRGNGPTLFVVGTTSAVSRGQALLLEQIVPLRIVRVSPRLLLGGEAAAGWADTAVSITGSLKAGADTLVMLDAEESVAFDQRPLLTEALGAMLAPCVNLVGALVATGGETARAILNSWNVSLLQVVGEVDRGVPYSVAELEGRTIPVLTKAGGFGDNDALLRCWEFVVGLSDERLPLRKNS